MIDLSEPTPPTMNTNPPSSNQESSHSSPATEASYGKAAQEMANRILQHLSSKQESESFEAFQNRVIESLRKKGLFRNERPSPQPATPGSESPTPTSGQTATE